MEFYAGKAEATKMFQFAGHKVAKLDLLYMSARDEHHQNPMDLTTDAGMGTLDCNNKPIDIRNTNQTSTSYVHTCSNEHRYLYIDACACMEWLGSATSMS